MMSHLVSFYSFEGTILEYAQWGTLLGMQNISVHVQKTHYIKYSLKQQALIWYHS